MLYGLQQKSSASILKFLLDEDHINIRILKLIVTYGINIYGSYFEA